MQDAALSPAISALSLDTARSLASSLEFAISDAKRCTTDDKLSVETRLVMVAMRLQNIDRLSDRPTAR